VIGNTSPCGEFGECCYPLGAAQELANELTCAGFAVWHLIQTPYCQVYELSMDTYNSSLILLDAILIPIIG
jgi:hypothetical protein